MRQFAFILCTDFSKSVYFIFTIHLNLDDLVPFQAGLSRHTQWLVAAILHSTAVDYTSSLGYMLGFARVFQNLKFYSGNHSLLKIHLRLSTSFCTTEGSHECPHETSHIMLMLREYCFWYGPCGNLEFLCKYIMASFEACCFVPIFQIPF